MQLVISRQNGITGMFLTVIFFYILNQLVVIFGIPVVIRSKGNNEVWKWKNLLLSWLHAFVVAVWDILCFYWYPEVLDDLIQHIVPFTYYMVVVSTGYFIYDSLDMIVHNKVFKLWELSFHHVAVISMFAYNVIMMECIGYNVVALLAEVSSFFLHSRKMMQMLGYPFNNLLYRLNAVVNIVLFSLCRGGSLLCIVHGMVNSSHRVAPSYFYPLCASMFIMCTLNPILFFILLKNDFFRFQSSCTAVNSIVSDDELQHRRNDSGNLPTFNIDKYKIE